MSNTSFSAGLTFAVVDDDPSVRKALRRFLRSEGWDVVACDSAETLMSRSDLERIHCMILEIRLPGLSGPDLRRALEARGVRIPTVFITGHRNECPAHSFAETGDTVLIRKPFDAALLLHAISQVTTAPAGPA